MNGIQKKRNWRKKEQNIKYQHKILLKLIFKNRSSYPTPLYAAICLFGEKKLWWNKINSLPTYLPYFSPACDGKQTYFLFRPNFWDEWWGHTVMSVYFQPHADTTWPYYISQLTTWDHQHRSHTTYQHTDWLNLHEVYEYSYTMTRGKAMQVIHGHSLSQQGVWVSFGHPLIHKKHCSGHLKLFVRNF